MAPNKKEPTLPPQASNQSVQSSKQGSSSSGKQAAGDNMQQVSVGGVPETVNENQDEEQDDFP